MNRLNNNVIEILPVRKSLNHTMQIIGSKSMSHRALIIAALGKGRSLVRNLSQCEDVLHTQRALEACGIKIFLGQNGHNIEGRGGNFDPPQGTLYFGNSGTSYRFFISLACLFHFPVQLYGSSRMNTRPIRELIQILKTGDVKVKYLEEEGFPPVEIEGSFWGGSYSISSATSSQFISSLLLISPFLSQDVIMTSSGVLRSVPYIKMTCNLMRNAGIQMESKFTDTNLKVIVPASQDYNPLDLTIEGDYSGAAFFLVAAAILGGCITIKGLMRDSLQGDKFILTCLARMGCQIHPYHDKVTLIQIHQRPLLPLDIDLGDYPDLVMPLAIAALFSDGITRFTNIAHLRVKESDRLAVLHRNLKSIGAQTEITNDSITIHPAETYQGAEIDPDNDHRIAMCFSIAGLQIPGIKIRNPECVNKSFPDFFEKLNEIGLEDKDNE